MKYSYNENIKNKKVAIQKVKVSLFGLGLGLALTGLNACNDNKFEYDQSKDSSLSEQFEEEIGKKLNPKIKGELNQMRPYEIAVDDYNDLVSVKAENEKIVDARVDVISDTNGLINAATAIIELKIIDGLELSSNALFEYKDMGNSKDGPNYVIKVTDKDKSYEIDKLPNKVFKMLNLIDAIKEYKGNGKSSAWDKAMDNYLEHTEELYYLTLDLASDTNFKVKAEEITKKIVK